MQGSWGSLLQTQGSESHPLRCQWGWAGVGAGILVCTRVAFQVILMSSVHRLGGGNIILGSQEWRLPIWAEDEGVMTLTSNILSQRCSQSPVYPPPPGKAHSPHKSSSRCSLLPLVQMGARAGHTQVRGRSPPLPHHSLLRLTVKRVSAPAHVGASALTQGRGDLMTSSLQHPQSLPF